MKPVTVTVAYPTFNRGERIHANVLRIIASGWLDSPDHELLVLIDGSTDDTVDLLSTVNHPRLRVVRNERNEGFEFSFWRLFGLAESDYLWVLSDEDLLDFNEVSTIESQIRRHQPSLLVGAVQGRRAARSGPIGESWRSATTYISGLIFRVSDIRELIERFPHLVRGNSFTRIYPQCVAGLLLYVSGKALVYTQHSSAVAVPSRYETEIRPRDGGNYWDLERRVDQFLDLHDIISCIVSSAEERQAQRRAATALRRHEEYLLNLVVNAIAGDPARRHLKKQLKSSRIPLPKDGRGWVRFCGLGLRSALMVRR